MLTENLLINFLLLIIISSPSATFFYYYSSFNFVYHLAHHCRNAWPSYPSAPPSFCPLTRHLTPTAPSTQPIWSSYLTFKVFSNSNVIKTSVLYLSPGQLMKTELDSTFLPCHQVTFILLTLNCIFSLVCLPYKYIILFMSTMLTP